jgi:hypothetical protein
MNDDDALPFEMRQRLGSRGSSPPTLDHDTADRLLAGQLDPADAPPGYAAVAKVVSAASAPATTEELAGEPAAVAQFVAMARSGSPTRASTNRRAGVPRRLLSVKAAAAVLAAVLSIGGVAAATGVFPGPAKPPAGHGPDSSGGGVATTPGRSDAATTTSTAAGEAGSREPGGATGPDASGPARDGLCRAWLAGQGTDHGKREDSPAFRALAAAAGGADKIAAYCQATPPADSASQGSGQGGQGGQSSPPTSANPPGSGAGHGNLGGPPPTTD